MMSYVKIRKKHILYTTYLFLFIFLLFTFVFVTNNSLFKYDDIILQKKSFGEILNNNFTVLIYNYLLCPLFGIYNIIYLFINTIIFSYTLVFSTISFGTKITIFRLFPHAFLEIPVIVISSSHLFSLYEFISIYKTKNKDTSINNICSFIKYNLLEFIICVVLVVASAIIESYISMEVL